MKKYKVVWYDQNQIIKTDEEPIEASNEQEATQLAYLKYNGNPPGPVLYLEEIK